MKNQTYISKSQASRLAGVTPPTIQTWIEKGYLSAYQVGNKEKISKEELLLFIQPKKVN